MYGDNIEQYVKNKKNYVKNFRSQISNFCLPYLIDNAETAEQCSTSVATAPTTLNAYALSTESEISRWSTGCDGSTMVALPSWLEAVCLGELVGNWMVISY